MRKVCDSTVFKLSDLVETIEVVPLETTKESLIVNPYFYVGKDYIICLNNRSEVLIFSRKGEFITTVAGKGNGPNDFLVASMTIDEQKSSFTYLFEKAKQNYLVQFDPGNPTEISHIPYAIKGEYNSIRIVDNNTLLLAPVYGGNTSASEYALIWQDKEGNLINSIKNPNNVPKRRMYGLKILHNAGKDIKYRPVNSDSVYTVMDTGLIPDWYFDCNNDVRDNPGDKKLGDVYVEIISETSDFLILLRTQITKLEKSGNDTFIGYEADYIYVNKETKGCFIFYDLENDFFGYKYPMHEFKIQSNGLCTLSYESIDLLNLIEDKDSTIVPYFNELNKILRDVTKDDNPILIIGKIKNGRS